MNMFVCSMWLFWKFVTSSAAQRGLIVTGTIYQATQPSNYKSNDSETFHFSYRCVELHTIKFQSAELFCMNNAIFELFASKICINWHGKIKKRNIVQIFQESSKLSSTV